MQLNTNNYSNTLHLESFNWLLPILGVGVVHWKPEVINKIKYLPEHSWLQHTQHVEIIQPVPPYFGGKSSPHMSVGGSVFPFSFFTYRSFDENQQNWSNLHQRTKVFPNFFVRKLRNFARKKTPVGAGVGVRRVMISRRQSGQFQRRKPVHRAPGHRPLLCRGVQNAQEWPTPWFAVSRHGYGAPTSAVLTSLKRVSGSSSSTLPLSSLSLSC